MKDIGLITLARVLVIACQLINIKLYTNFLSVKQLGLYFFLLTISYFANALIFVPVDYYQQANLVKVIKITGGASPLLRFNLKLMAVYLLAVFGASMVGMFIMPNFVYHIILVGTLAIALYIVQALRNTLNNLEHRGAVSFSLVQEAVVKILMFVLMVKYFLPDELLLMAAWLIALLLTAVSLYLKASKFGVFYCSEKYVVETRAVFHFSYPISVGAICNWIQLQGYRLILVPLGFAEIVGIFATIAGIGSAGMAAAATIFNQAYSPNIYKTAGQYTITYLRKAVALIVIVLMICILFGDLIVQLSTSAAFKPYWGLLIIGVIVDAANLIIGALTIHITLTSSTKKIMVSSVLGVIALVTGLGSIVLTNQINIYTIGLPLIFSQFVVIAYMYWNFQFLNNRQMSTND